MIVRCIDNTLQHDVLVVGLEYVVRAERDDCYILSGFDKGFSKTRFVVVMPSPQVRRRRRRTPAVKRAPPATVGRTVTQ